MPSTAAVAFDPFEPGFAEWPYDQYARLRTAEPVHRSALLEGWVLTRFEDVSTVLRNPTISVDLGNAAPSGVVELQRDRMRKSGRSTHTVVLRDDPDHSRLRKLLQRPFGPRPVERLRDMVVARVEGAMAELAPTGKMDVIADFAYPLPVALFCEMFGIPDEASPKFREWTMAVVRSLDPVIDDEEHARCIALIDEMYDYLDEQVEVKRRAPADDVMTELVQAEEDGDRLTRDELVAQLVTLYVAGHEPITGVVGNGLLALLRQPEQLALLQARPDLLPNAIHELLRYDGPNQFVRRIAVEPITIDGQRIEPGDVLYLCIAAANHDPERWEDAAAVHIDRPDAPHHLQFGAGVHTCLGSHLARLHSEVALGALVHQLDAIELASDPVWSDRMVIRGLQSLPITFHPKAAA
ncbi:MAG TPA: cytochrome P450 [Acidimicrobiales bacterium]|jgi:cytochrome P450